MLNKIIHFSLHNRIMVLVASVLLLVGGFYTAYHTEVDVFPDLTAPTVVVMTEANGMAAEEVEQLVTFPIETTVNGATHVRRVRSSSTNGFSVIWVEFDWDTDIYLARQIVSEKLTLVNEELPENVGKPVTTDFLRCGHGLHEALFNAKFQKFMKFAIMYEASPRWGGTDETDLVENIMPFWMETYFKRDNYLIIDNKPVLFVYSQKRLGEKCFASVESKLSN